ncbi:MAG: hypothetical protein Q9221_008444 [Calogaya cf. arnoldii]
MSEKGGHSSPMSLSDDMLFEDDFKMYQFNTVPKTYLEIWVFEGIDQTTLREGPFDDGDLQSWIDQKGRFAPPVGPNGEAAAGGLRLICDRCHQMPRNHLGFATEDFASLLKYLMIPRSFLWSLRGDSNYFIPSSQLLERTQSRRLGIGINSAYGTVHSLLSLSWDPSSSVTSGFFAYEDDNYNQKFLSYLRRLGSQARLPMAPLLLLLRAWIERAWAFNSQGQRLLRSVEVALGFAGVSAADFGFGDNDIPADHATAHQSLVKASTWFTSRNHQFMYAVTDAVALLLRDWPQWTLWQKGQIPKAAMSELDAQFAHLQMVTGSIKLVADQALTRVDLQMRLLYNLMQQKDSISSQSIALDSKKLAEASTRDSSSMKAVAVLTMVFLPSTAVATIFSMGPFWSFEPGSIFSVSAEFWLYWAITLPLTTVVIIVWQTWLWLYRRRQSRRMKDIEGATEKKAL